jgi:hypothetical protein
MPTTDVPAAFATWLATGEDRRVFFHRVMELFERAGPESVERMHHAFGILSGSYAHSTRIDPLQWEPDLLVVPHHMADAFREAVADLNAQQDMARTQLVSDLVEALSRATFKQLAVDQVALAQSAMQVEAQAELAREFGLWTAAEVADLGASTADNRSAMASRWEKEGQIFAVVADGQRRFPGFQLDPRSSFRPRPIVGDVVSMLRDAGYEGWEIALWWTTRLGALADQRPVDRLDDVDSLLQAAQAERVPAAR